MEIRRFGPGHRRPEGPPGSRNMSGRVIHSDARGVVAELVFKPHAMIAPHSNPNLTLFIVISGGGFVQVDGERARVNHGEAVVWPAGVPHGAYTEGGEMRALVVEFPTGEEGIGEALIGSAALTASTGDAPSTTDPVATDGGRRAGQEGLAEPTLRPDDYDASTGEPW